MRHLMLLTLLLTATPTLAHDLWMEPTSFRPPVGAIVGVRLRVGDHLLGEPVPRDPVLINQFIVVDSSRRAPVVGRDGADPAGLFRAVQGLQIIGYRSNPSPLVLSPEKFDQYLKEEGLEAIAMRRAGLTAGRQVREIFSRSAKSLVLTGPPSQAQSDRAIGLPLELVAERNPYMMTSDQELPIRLLYEGQPLANALVVALNGLDPSKMLKTRSGADGRVKFALPTAGMWLIKAVHMVPAPAQSNADWASVWASLTFELRFDAVALQ